MCLIECRRYIYPEGDRIVENIRPCPRASGSRLCKNIQRRSVEAFRVVETSPSRENNSPDGVIVTEGQDGRQRVYRDLSKRSSNSSSVRGTTMSDRSPISPPSSNTSPSNADTKPTGPTMPPSDADPAPLERTRMPYPPAPSPPDPTRVVTPQGTAIYNRPPSLDSSRASDNERPMTSRLDKRVSFSSTAAEVDDDDVEPTSSKLPRRPTISLDTNVRPSRSSSSPSIDSPATAKVLKSSLRRDSGKAIPNRDSRVRPERRRTNSNRQDRSSRDANENRRRQQDHGESEQDRLVRIERERLASSDRRRRDASRERHRQDAAATLEGQRDREQLSVDPVQLQRDAEFAQMARERAASDARKRESDQAQRDHVPRDSTQRDQSQRYADNQLRRDADARVRYQSDRTSDRGSPSANRLRRSVTSDGYKYPLSGPSPTLSARTPYSGTAGTGPIIHQYPSARRRDSQTIRERGEEVIAREQARAATTTDALGDLSIDDPEDDEYELVDDYYVSEGQDRRRRRDRERRAQQFYR